MNRSYLKEHGRDYLGSRDVDLGFHIDMDWSLEELRHSVFARGLKVIEDSGYIRAGTSRYCKLVHRQTRAFLDERDASKVPLQDLFYLNLDPIVDHIHPEHAKLFSIKPIDEPLLSEVFSKGHLRTVQIGETDIFLPDTVTLLATKLASFPQRDKEHEMVKDACDIYALLWHSPDDLGRLTSSVKERPFGLTRDLSDLMEPPVSLQASAHLGVDHHVFAEVVSTLSIRANGSIK